jgi:hypothetical protein
MRKSVLALAAVAGAAMFVSGPSQAAAVAIGAKASMLGLGAEATIGINDYLNLRVPFNTFSYDYDDKDGGDVAYEGKLKLNSVGAQLDVHPFKGSFYLSGGLFANSNKINALARTTDASEAYEVGDSDYYTDPNDPLALRGRIDFKKTVPYLGLGWGNAIQGASNFYFRFELGAYFQGAPKIDLTPSGSATTGPNGSGDRFTVGDGSAVDQQFQAELETERADLEDDTEDYKIYPVVGLALGWRFKL